MSKTGDAIFFSGEVKSVDFSEIGAHVCEGYYPDLPPISEEQREALRERFKAAPAVKRQPR